MKMTENVFSPKKYRLQPLSKLFSTYFSSKHTKTKILVGFSIPLSLTVIIALVVYFSINNLLATSVWVKHTHVVITGATELEKLMLDMETGERGFLITGEEKFLQPFNQAKRLWKNKIDALKILVDDNPTQVQKLERIDQRQKAWFNEAATVEIALRRKIKEGNVDFSVLQQVITASHGKDIMDNIRADLKQFIAVEEGLIIIREAEAESSSTTTLNIVIFTAMLAMLISLLIALVVSNHIVNNLHKLLTATKMVIKGDHDTQIQSSSDDEFGQLSDSFNKMTLTIKTSTEKQTRATQVKSDFLANMSHEIRTPMSGVLGTLTMLEETGLSPVQDDLVKIIRSCGDGLLVVINDILDLSKLEAGQLTLEKRPFHLAQHINECIFLLDPLASKKGLILKTEIDNNLSDGFTGDIIRIRQVIINLLSNAIKFTASGKIKLRINLEKQEGELSYLLFSVIDQGIGISPVEQQKLFKPFSQVDNSTSRKYGGTGLGLTICQQLIKQMLGVIKVSSEKDKGSTFYFTIPLPTAEISEIENRQKQQSIISTQMAKDKPLAILVVEDNAINQKIALNLFKKLGYQADIAENGLIAIEALNKITYDVVFMDMQMPVMDGIEATQKIIEKWPDKRPKIIAMTANVLLQDQQRCFDAGMDDFIGKPINVEHVVTALNKC